MTAPHPNPDPAYDAVVATPLFAIGIRCDAEEVLAVDYLSPRAERAPDSPLAHEAARQVRAYLADPRFEFGLPLAPVGTRFQRRVWDVIAGIPSGRTMSYGEVALAIRSGPRAVGNACGANRYCLVVPCHRVLAAHQALGGYGRAGGGWSLDVKRWLLAHEKR